MPERSLSHTCLWLIALELRPFTLQMDLPDELVHYVLLELPGLQVPRLRAVRPS